MPYRRHYALARRDLNEFPACCKPRRPRRKRGYSSRGAKHLVDFDDQLAEVKRLGEHARLSACKAGLIQSDRGEARDEHDTKVRENCTRATGELDAIDSRHDDIGKQKIENGPVGESQRFFAISDSTHDVTGALECTRQKRAHVVVVFSKEDASHFPCADPEVELTSNTASAGCKASARIILDGTPGDRQSAS